MTKPVELTLAQQLKITPHEIEYRKHLFDFTEEDAERLSFCRPTLEAAAKSIVDAFYREQIKNDEIAGLIGDADTLRRLRTSLQHYIVELCGGRYDLDYVNRRLHIGKMHRRVGVTPKLYMSSIRRLQSLIDDHVDTWDGDPVSKREARRFKKSLHKILLLDAQFVFDAYIDSFLLDVDAVCGEVETYARALELSVPSQTRQLRELSSTDTLTGLYNHRSFYDFIGRELAVAKRYRLPLSLVYIDLNGFKELNDKQGHEAGNRLLATFGAALRGSVRRIDIACRYGGDEFCLILPRSDADSAIRVCERLVEQFCAADNCGVTFSAGIAQVGPVTYADTHAVVRMADRLMYAAKERAHREPGFQIEASVLTAEMVDEISAARVSGEAAA